MTETSTIQKAVESSLTWGWAPSPYLHTECDLRELRQSPTSGRDSTISYSFICLQPLKAAKNKNFL